MATSDSSLILQRVVSGTYSGNKKIWTLTSGLFEGVLTKDEFEPYVGDTFLVAIPQEVGTLYGGDIDMVAGTLTVTMGYIASYAGEELPGAWISDRDVYEEGKLPTIGAQVAYRLAQPLTYDIEAGDVTLLDGTNVMWARQGEITVGINKGPQTSQGLLGGPLMGGLHGGGLLSGQNGQVNQDLFKPIVSQAPMLEDDVGDTP